MTGYIEKRSPPTVTKDDIGELRSEGKKDRCAMMEIIDDRFESQDKILVQQNKALERIETALFAQDTANEFQTRGVMTVMKKIDHHIDEVCKFGRWAWRTFIALLGATATVLVIMAQMKGWFPP